MRGGTLTKKELVEIGGRPIIWHVMRIFSAFGHNQFVLPLGYEAQQLKRYFLTYEAMSRDVTVHVGREEEHVTYHGQSDHPEWTVALVDTGLHTDKASRVARVAGYLNSERFFLTYGDGVSDVDINRLLAFHKAHGKLATITAVRPSHYQYGIMRANDEGLVSAYEQYPEMPDWINGGFMVFEHAALDWMRNGDEVALETGVLQELVAAGELMMYRHNGFWQSMDTLKDANELEKIWQNGAPWRSW